MRTVPLVVFVVSGSAVMAERAAEACSPERCFGGYLLPGDGATVPANLPGIAWQPQGVGVEELDLAKVTLADADAPSVALAIEVAAIPGTGVYLLVPKAPLVAGKRYVVADNNTCRDIVGPTATFTAGAAAPLPTSLGTAVAAATGMAKLSLAVNAACDASVNASRARVDLALSADAQPWRDVLQYTTWVDGAPWRPQATSTVQPPPWTSWTGRGTDVVYRSCSSDDPYYQHQDAFARGGLDAGPHQVLFKATLAGTELALQSAAATPTVACGDEDPPGDGGNDDGGCAATGGAASWLVLGLGALVLRRRR